MSAGTRGRSVSSEGSPSRVRQMELELERAQMGRARMKQRVEDLAHGFGGVAADVSGAPS